MMGDRLRINAQLIDTRSDDHLWAERNDGDMGKIFEFQDCIRRDCFGARIETDAIRSNSSRTQIDGQRHGL